MRDFSNLTTMEVDALSDGNGGLNLTDGHARLPLTDEQAVIVQRIPEMFGRAFRTPYAELERDAHRALFSAIGQTTAPVDTGRILSCYSSTLATDIVARALPDHARVAVLHPTFDNIADLLRTRGLELVPLAEEEVARCHWPTDVEVIFLTHPNNPTGVVIAEDQMRSLARHAAEHGQLVILDASFRGQVRAAQYDSYAVFDVEHAQWITIEDTGKLWPTHELKLGLLAWSANCELPLEKAFSESMLSASPVVLQLVTALAGDWVSGGYERAHDLVETNRNIVREAIAGTDLQLADPTSEISVARIALPEYLGGSSGLYTQLRERGVHVLPCSPFHWAEPEEGQRFVRLSLARPREVVQSAAAVLAEVCRQPAATR